MLTLNDLHVGSIDAKYELIGSFQTNINIFKKTFILPGNVRISDFLSGKKFFVSGLKGTGKTALLRFLEIEASARTLTSTGFVLFKSDFSEDERRGLEKVGRLDAISKDQIPGDSDFEASWTWFFHRLIVSKMASISLFMKDGDWERYKACVSALKMPEEKTGIIQPFPKPKKGSFEVSSDVKFLSAKLGLDFEFEDEAETRIKLSKLANQASALFRKLSPLMGSLYIFVDELEISFASSKSYQRDLRIIRDLILSIERFNLLCRECKFPIFIIAAIRSEILSRIEAAGKEINKPLNEFGVPISWHQSGGERRNHPLLRMLIGRIQASEEQAGNTAFDNNSLWKKWFPENIQREEPEDYILHNTWYRPRDIVQMMRLAQDHFPDKTMFEHSVFDQTRKEYSTRCWAEMSEELKVMYTDEEIEGIKQVLYAITKEFNLNGFISRVNKLSELYGPVKTLSTSRKVPDLLNHLYNLGLIGNIQDGKNRWAFRGDDRLILEQPMTVHRALRPILSIT